MMAHTLVAFHRIVPFLLILAISTSAFAQDAPTSRDGIELTKEERQWLDEHPVIRVAPDPDFPPFEFIDDSGQYRGIAADYLELLEERLPIQFEIVNLKNWTEVIEHAKAHKIDMWAAAAETPRRREYMAFSEPHIQLPGVIITTTDTSGALTLEDLHGKRVVVVSGYVWHDWLAHDHPQIKLVIAPDIASALQMTAFKIADAMVGDQATTTHYIGSEGLTNLRVAGKPDYEYDLALAVRKDWPELVRILNKALATITSTERTAILDRWILLKTPSIFQSRRFWIVVTSIVSIVLAVIGGILLWNRSLKAQVAQRTKELNEELEWRKAAEEELRQHRDHLDELVKIRTAELTAANEKMKQDLEAAAQVQQALLPQTSPESCGVRFAWFYRPCDELGGDILNVFELDPNHVAIYLADVSGHGVAASLLSVMISRVLAPQPSASSLLLRMHEGHRAHRIVPPSEVAQELNKRFSMEEMGGKFFTIVYGVLNTKTNVFRYVRAGHPPLVLTSSQGTPRVLRPGSMAIGWLAEADFEEHVVQLNSGDRLVIYSDGIPEAMDSHSQQFGEERLVETLMRTFGQPLEESLAQLVHDVEDWCGQPGPMDDVSIVAAEIP
jgi:serine phosphatase RsbU (regulator of sigma subunit)/ABC-type amino acid transport substrate-binding protein